MVEEIELVDGEGLTECGVKCELHATNCDFFGFGGTKCYIGDYSQTDGLTVTVPENIRTYHKLGKYYFIFAPLQCFWCVQFQAK